MTELKKCPQCGKQLAADAPAGLCPECLLKQGLESGTGSDSLENTTAMSGFIPPEPEELAEKFPQLEILELIGKGGMGAVYRARQPNLDRLIALKILPPEAGNDPAFAERFTREARALARLNHPNIVAVYDFGEADGLYYFLMEYVDGTDIRKMIREGHIQPDEALAVVPQICEALQYAHEEGIVHRDIKPENILVDKKGRVKIADFGLAKIVIGNGLSPGEKPFTLTGTNQVMGTIHYMAPEQIEHPLAVDHRADIYSLGVVFYEMLTGELPLGRFAPPSQRVRMDVRLDEVVLRSLEKEPEKRYQHANDVKTDVETICGLLPKQVAGRIYGYEYRSQTTLFGWPLVHIATGIDPATGRKRIAKGVIAIGDVAFGGLAIGGFAMGGIVFGGGGVGLLTFAGLAIGLLAAVGGLAVGGFAFGGLAVGGIAIGGGAVGIFAYGGSAWGLHPLGSDYKDPRAVEFFDPWASSWSKWLAALGMYIPAAITLMGLVVWFVIRAQAKKNSLKEESSSETGNSLEARKPDPESIQRRVNGVADALIVIACIALLTAIGIGFWLGFAPAAPLLERQNRFTLMGMSITHAVYAFFMISAAVLLRQLQARMFVLLCVTIAGIAFPAMMALNVIMELEHIPEWPIGIPFWLGVPVAVWATILLFRDDVQEAFDQQASKRAADRSVSETGASLEQSILGKVKGPAIGLIVLGGINLLVFLMYVLGTLVQWEEEGWAAAWSETLEMGPIVLTGMALSVPFSIVMILAGVRMLNFRSHALAVAAGILTLLPFSITFVIGLPLGIWALVVLTRQKVREAFEKVREKNNTTDTSSTIE